RSSQPLAQTSSYVFDRRSSRGPVSSAMQWSNPSIRWYWPGASLGPPRPGSGWSKPNRLITPSMSTARIGASLVAFFVKMGIGGKRSWLPSRADAEHQSARPQGTNPQEEEDVDAGPEVWPGSQEARRRSAAA